MRKQAIISHSNEIAQKLGLKLEDKEYWLGTWGRSDNFVRINDSLIVLFEVEIAQRHPEMNVLKLWAFLEQNPNQKFVLIQYFVKRNSCSPNRLRLIEWIHTRMCDEFEGRFRYHMVASPIEHYHIETINKSIDFLSK